MSNMILVGWVVSEDLSTLGWETVVSKDKSPMSYSLFLELLSNEQTFVMMTRLNRNIFSKSSFIILQSERSELKGFYISFFKESTLYVISFSYSSCRKKQSGMAGRLFVTDCCHFPDIIILYVTILSKEKHFLPQQNKGSEV